VTGQVWIKPQNVMKSDHLPARPRLASRAYQDISRPRRKKQRRGKKRFKRAAFAIQKMIKHGVWNWCPPHCQVALVIVGVLRYQDFGGLGGCVLLRVFLVLRPASASLQSAGLQSELRVPRIGSSLALGLWGCGSRQPTSIRCPSGCRD